MADRHGSASRARHHHSDRHRSVSNNLFLNLFLVAGHWRLKRILYIIKQNNLLFGCIWGPLKLFAFVFIKVIKSVFHFGLWLNINLKNLWARFATHRPFARHSRPPVLPSLARQEGPRRGGKGRTSGAAVRERQGIFKLLPPCPRTTPFPEDKTILGVLYGDLLWADMNAAIPLGAWGRSVIAVERRHEAAPGRHRRA